MSACPAFGADGPGGVAEALRAVDCQSGAAVASAFARLFGADGALGQALGLALTLYVGLLAVSLLTGRSNLSLSALTPRMLGLGLALTFATSWAAYQTVVWNLLVGAPDQIAGVLIGAKGSATELFAARLDQLFNAVAASAAAQGQGPNGQPMALAPNSPASLLNLSALMLLLGTVGVLIVARLALAALLAVGPVFILLAVFRGTRGLFEGWLKTSVLFAVVPLIAVLVGGAAIGMLAPVVQALAGAGADVPPRLAVTVFLGASVHLALSALAFKAAASLTSGWRIPLGASGRAEAAAGAAASAPAAVLTPASSVVPASGPPGSESDRARALAAELARPEPPAAGDGGTIPRSARERVVIPFPGARATDAPGPASAHARDSRVQGLAQRFRSPAPTREARP